MTRPTITCPTFDRIDLVICEDGATVMAYAYPNAHDDQGMIALNLDDLPAEAFDLPTHLHDDDDDDDDDDWHAH